MPCPTLVASSSYGSSAGLSGDGTLLYTVYLSGIEVWDFPSLAWNSYVDLDPAMNGLGAGGGGNIQVGTLADDGYLYAAAYVTTGASLQLFKVLLDGTGEELLWTAPVATADQQSIGWHPNDPDHIYLLYITDTAEGFLSKIHRTTGSETVVGYFPVADTVGGRDNLQQYNEGFAFYLDAASVPGGGDIWVYDIGADAFDSLPTDSMRGFGTAPTGLTYWVEDTIDLTLHAFEVLTGPVISEITPACVDPWLSSWPSYWFATPDRSQMYVGDGFYVWVWNAAPRMLRVGMLRMRPTVQTSGSFCIDIDGPLLVPEGTTVPITLTDLMRTPLDGSSVVATPPDARFTFDGVDAISLPAPTDDFLYAVLDVTINVSFTGGDGDGALAQVRLGFYDVDDNLFAAPIDESNDEGETTVVGTTTGWYVNEPGSMRVLLANNHDGDLYMTGTLCFDWRIEE